MKVGIKEGRNKKKIELARNLLDVLDVKTISIKTGLRVLIEDACCEQTKAINKLHLKTIRR